MTIDYHCPLLLVQLSVYLFSKEDQRIGKVSLRFLIYTGKLIPEAWYNAGSALLILIILLSGAALYFYFRRVARLRRRGSTFPRDEGDAAERVPLGSERVELDDIERGEEYELDESGRKRRVDGRTRKGKGRAKEREEPVETVFALGDDDDR